MTASSKPESLREEHAKRRADEVAQLPGSDKDKTAGVDKMRELLFGNQMQDYDKRFNILEDRFQQRLRDMEMESSRAIQSLEHNLEKLIGSLVSEEKRLRADADNEMERKLRKHIEALDRRLTQVSDQLNRVPAKAVRMLDPVEESIEGAFPASRADLEFGVQGGRDRNLESRADPDLEAEAIKTIHEELESMVERLRGAHQYFRLRPLTNPLAAFEEDQ